MVEDRSLQGPCRQGARTQDTQRQNRGVPPVRRPVRPICLRANSAARKHRPPVPAQASPLEFPSLLAQCSPQARRLFSALAGQPSGLERRPDRPRLRVWSPVRAHARSNQRCLDRWSNAQTPLARSLAFSLPLPKNQYIKINCRRKENETVFFWELAFPFYPRNSKTGVVGPCAY